MWVFDCAGYVDLHNTRSFAHKVSMNIYEANGISSRIWPVTIKNYWFGQRPTKNALPDIAKLHSIRQPLKGAINIESWTLLTDLTGTDSDLMALLHRDTREQVRRAEREGISVERYESKNIDILNNFEKFYLHFANSKAEVRDALQVSIQLHMLKKKAYAGILQVSRAVGRDGEPLVYRVYIVADGRTRNHLSASLFREGQSNERRHYVGRANRYLHWQNMLHYKHLGYSQYDMGGWYSGKDNESLLRVNRFKEAFGGRVVCEYDAIYGCTLLGRCLLPFRTLYRVIRDSVFRKTT
ncbi:MAG: hypothetical protein C0403_08655 [Desulfobacterium sp.]|nr:hypothetical protein [Desulfobacterium sp.]